MSRFASTSLVALVLASAATATAAPAASNALPQPITLARHQALGATVTVVGSVTVQSNAFDPGFAIQDLVDGIYVADSQGADRRIGDLVLVTGTLVDNFGLLAIQPTQVIAIGHALALPPRRQSTASIGEATEGRLLALHGTQVGDLIDDGPFGFKLNIDDRSGPVQLFIYPGTGISTAGLVDGANLRVTCFSNQFDTHYECDPRRPADLRID